MVQDRIAESIQAALGLIQNGELDAALEKVDQALALVEEPLGATVTNSDDNSQNNITQAQRKMLIELYSHLMSAREAVSSHERYSNASTKLSFALCQLQVAAANSTED